MEAVAILALGLLAWVFLLPLGLWINAATNGRRLRVLEDERSALASLQEETRVLRERVARLEAARGTAGAPDVAAPVVSPAVSPVVPPVMAPVVAPAPPPPPPPHAPRPAAVPSEARLNPDRAADVAWTATVVPKVRQKPEPAPEGPAPAAPDVPGVPTPALAGAPVASGFGPTAPTVDIPTADAPTGAPIGAPIGDAQTGAPRPHASPADAPAAGAPPVDAPSSGAPRRPMPPVRPPVVPPASVPPLPVDRDWEVVVGANWLSKIGVLVLVVGLALFLGYSLANMGPFGRLAVGAVASLVIFAIGRAFENRERYTVLGHALVGGGWSGLYFTTYAAHGLEASRVIDSPIVGAVMLAIVAAALIADSLRYRVEAVTGLAFASGFATLLIAPGDGFAHMAIVGFAGALLAVARRLGWRGLAVFGALAAYGTLLVRPDAVPWTGETLTVLTVGKGSLVVLWLLFEAYGISGVGADDAKEARTAEAAVWLVNLGGFLLVTFAHVHGSTSAQRMTFFMTCGAAYVVSAALRGWRERQRPATAVDDAELAWADGMTRAAGSLAAALGLVTLALVQLPDGQFQTALLVEAQVVFVAGLAMRPVLLRSAASVLFAIVVTLIFQEYGEVKGIGAGLVDGVTWPRLAMAAAALMFVNDALSRRRDGHVGLEPAYTLAGTALVVALIEWRVDDALLGPAWLLTAIALFAWGLGRDRLDLRGQAYAVGLLAALTTAMQNGILAPEHGLPWTRSWLPLGLCAAALWGMGLALARPAAAGEEEHPDDVQAAALVAVWIGCGLMLVLAERARPDLLPAVRLGAIAVALFESGRLARSPLMRGMAHLLVYVGLFVHVTNLGSSRELFEVPQRLWSAGGLAGVALWLRWRRDPEQNDVEQLSDKGLAWAPSALLTMAVPAELDGWPIASVWAGLGLAYGVVASRTGHQAERLRGFMLVALAFVAAMVFALAGEGTDLDATRHGFAVVVVLIVLAWLSPGRDDAAGEDVGSSVARPVLACLATVLAGTILAAVLETRWLTLAWGVLGTLSLVLGFALRERFVRLAGLGWLSLCTLKLFIYDLSGLDTPFRILSFIVLGLLMIGASWVYARLEEVAQR